MIDFLKNIFLEYFVYKRRKLYTYILSSFLLLYGVIFALTLYIDLSNFDAIIDGFLKFTITQSSQSTIENIKATLQHTNQVLSTGSGILMRNPELDMSNQNILLYFVDILRNNKVVKNIYAGAEDGAILSVLRTEQFYIGSIDRKLPLDVEFAVLVTDSRGKSSCFYLSDQNEIIDQDTGEKFQNFDARSRPWYQKAIQVSDKNAMVVVDPYISNPESYLLSSCAKPFYDKNGRVKGVISLDIAPHDIFKTLNVDASDQILHFILFKGSGEIIVEKQRNNDVENAHEFKNILDAFEGQVPQKFFTNYIAHNKSVLLDFETDRDNKKFIGNVFPLSKEILGQDVKLDDWGLMVFLPRQHFSKEFHVILQKKYFVTLLFMVFVALVTFLLSKKISAPIIQLSQRAQKLHTLNLEETEGLNTTIDEINILDDSIEGLRKSLISFSRFMPKKILDYLVSRMIQAKVGGTLKTITIFFSDIENFTHVSETYPIEKLMDHISDYFENLSDIIQDNDGTIDKYIGDSIMAFWGAPEANKFHCLRACETALLCQDRLVDLNRSWSLDKKPIFNTRIGIHTDNVLVGYVGSEKRLSYTAIGDGVNLASRLQNAGKIYNVRTIISEVTQHEIADDILTRPIDIVAVKGKDEPIKIFELVAMKNSKYSQILPSTKQIDFCERCAHAFSMYMEREWDRSIAEYESILKDFGDDYICKLYIERCMDLKRNPPQKDWNGVTVLHTK